ncbi:hypothetical protein SAMN05720471_1294 [Fibrobacter sp. UWP2]|nr:hypothetical protein SAMN05720471_1294 [Fibrobacter sp. UWP2]
MGLSVRTGAGGHLVDLGEGNFEPETTRILFVFFGSTNERLCRRACKNRDISYFKSHNTPIIYIYLQVRSTSSIPPSAPTSTKWRRIVLSIHLCTIKYKFAFEICQPLFPGKIAKSSQPSKSHFLSLKLSIFRGGGTMEHDTFGGAILAWVKSLRRARHGMPGQRHGPVQGKLHPRRGAGIELPASLRHGLRRERCHTAHVNLSET